MVNPQIPLLNVKFKLKGGPAVADRKILDGVRRLIIQKVNWVRLGQRMQHNVQSLLAQYLRAQPEYAALINNIGKLRTEFGIKNPNVVEQIINRWLSSITVRTTAIRKRGKGLYGKIVVEGVSTDLHDVLHLGTFTSEKGSEIRWLEWLLEAGDNIIITTHDVQFNPKYSRTGVDIMVRSNQGWRVPPEYSGTINNNYVTRAIDAMFPELEQLIISSIKRSL